MFLFIRKLLTAKAAVGSLIAGLPDSREGRYFLIAIPGGNVPKKAG
jgi:hypothetical protein